MQEKCRGCPHYKWEDGGNWGPDMSWCTAEGGWMPLYQYTRCPLEMAKEIAAAVKIDPESGCAECCHFGRVDMGWSHSDVTDYCHLTGTRDPERGIKGCTFRPSGR